MVYIQTTFIWLLFVFIIAYSNRTRKTKSDFNFCKKQLYPYGDYSQDTKTDMIIYLKELLGKVMFLDRSIDIDRVLQDWYIKSNYPILQEVGMEIQYQSTIDIIKDTIYPIEAQNETINDLLVEMRTKIPKSLICNDYLQINELLTMLSKIK